MRVAVVGGGIVGLFTAWYLERAGADVTLYEMGPLGAGSIHAAGIIEPATAYRTNTISFLKRVWRFWKSGTCTFRGADGRWLFESLRQLERDPPGDAEGVLREVSATSVAEYAALAQSVNDFAYAEGGLVERFDDPAHFAEERDLALAKRSIVPVEVREGAGPAGELFFPTVSWLDTERFVGRLGRELRRTHVLQRRVQAVDLDGTVRLEDRTERFEAVAVCSGVSCRRLGVPLTGVRGYGWRAKLRERPAQSLIHVDRGIAVVPLPNETKVTGGWDFDLTERPFHSPSVLRAIRRVVAVDDLIDFKQGARPCTPDGLPTVGRKAAVVVATGGFRLGWSFAPGMARHAARLCLGEETNDRFLSRYCGSLHGGSV